MIKTPQSAPRRPPRGPTRRIIGIDEYNIPDDASGIISETTMASFLMETSGINNSSPNKAAILRKKQDDARVAIIALNQFIFQAGNIYRGKKLNRSEEKMMRDSANHVGLSMHIVDALLEHTSDPNAVINFCMTSNDSIARKIKEDPNLSMLLEQDCLSEGGFNLRSSIWRIFMHKILQQVLRDHGMEINDVMSKSSLTAKLYEEALKSNLDSRESEYILRSAERKKLYRDYTKERIHLSLSEEEIKEARQNAYAQMDFEMHQPFDDLMHQENDVPLMIEGGGGKLIEARDDQMSRNTYTHGSPQRAPFSSIGNQTKNMRTPPSKNNLPVSQSQRNSQGERFKSTTRVSPFTQSPASDTRNTTPKGYQNSSIKSPEVQSREEGQPQGNNPGAPISAVKRALAMFENPSNITIQQQKKSYSASKVGRGSGSKIARKLALFEKGSQDDSEPRPVIESARSSEHTSIKTSSLFDVFATPKQNRSSTDRATGQYATTSKISRVKNSQLAVFEKSDSELVEDDKENYTKKVNKLNPEVRRLFDSNPTRSSSSGTQNEPRVTRNDNIVDKNKDFIAAKNGAVNRSSSENNGRLSAEDVSRLLQFHREKAPEASFKQSEASTVNATETEPRHNEEGKYYGQMDHAFGQDHIDSIDAAFDSISEDEKSFHDISSLKHNWKNRSTPPTADRRKKISSQSPTMASFQELVNDENQALSSNSQNDQRVARMQLGRNSVELSNAGTNQKVPVSESSRRKEDRFPAQQKSAMDKMLKYAQSPKISQVNKRQIRNKSQTDAKHVPTYGYKGEKEYRSNGEFNMQREREEMFLYHDNHQKSFNDTFSDGMDIEEFMGRTNESDDASWADFKNMVGSLSQTKTEINRVGSDLSSSKTKFQKMYNTLNQVKHEAMSLERRKPERDHDSTSKPVASTSRSFFEGIKLSGSKAEFNMVPDQNGSADLDSIQPMESLKGGNHSSERNNGYARHSKTPATADDPQQWAVFEDTNIDDEGKPEVSSRNNNFDTISYLQNGENMVASSMTNSADSEFDALNSYASKNAKNIQEEAYIHAPANKEQQNRGRDIERGSYGSKHVSANTSVLRAVESDSILEIQSVGEESSSELEIPAPPSQDPDLPSPPSEEDTKLPAPPSAVDDGRADPPYGENLEIQRSSSSLSQFLRINASKSVESDDSNDVGLNAVAWDVKKENDIIPSSSQEAKNNWDTSAIMQPESPGAFRSQGFEESPHYDDEIMIRANAELSGVPSQVIEIILNQTRKEDPEEEFSDGPASARHHQKDVGPQADLTSWDAIAQRDEGYVDTSGQTPLAGHVRDPSPAAGSNSSLVNHHRPFPEPSSVNYASFIPEHAPEGVSQEDLKLLNRFIELSSSNFDGKKLSAASEARVRNAALKVGLSEVMVDQLIEQARAKNEQYHQYHDNPAPQMFGNDGGGYEYQPASPDGSVDHRGRRRSQGQEGNPCSDPCQIIGNMKENILYMMGCNGGNDDDRSAV